MNESLRMYHRIDNKTHPNLSEKEKISLYINSFKEPAKSIIEQIKHKDYSCVLGVDASGRVPALIVGSFLGKEIFFDFPYSGNEINFNNITPGKKVLVIDDTLYGGTSILEVTRQSRKKNIPFDVGIFMSVNKTAEDIERYRVALEADKIFVGYDHTFIDAFDADTESQITETEIVKRKDISGVKRVGEYPEKRQVVLDKGNLNQEDFNFGREEIKRLASELGQEIT